MSTDATTTGDVTVATYLKTRLEQLGVDRMFGVAGNYTAALLDTILVDADSPITISGNPNEICAGYAADAYARYRGIGVLYVTYSVGAFSLLNTIAGSYAEQVPVLLVNGAPTNKEACVEANAGLIYSHTTGNELVDIEVFRPVTTAAERVTNATQAPFQIDSVLTAMLTEHRPGYLEVTEDVWRATCPAPRGTLSSGANAIVTSSDVDAAVEATVSLLRRRPRTVLWAGVELQRFGLQEDFLDLLAAANERHESADDRIRFVTTASGKSVISEDHPLFAGCVTLTTGEIDDLVGDDGVLLGLGAWTTSKNTGSQNIRGPGTVLATNDGVTVGALFFPLVGLASFMSGLAAAFRRVTSGDDHDAAELQRLHVPDHVVATPPAAAAPRDSDEITYDSLFAQLDGWLTERDIVVSDAGFPLISAQSLHIGARNGFVAQASWLAIGYSVAAATGVKCANPDRRAVVVVGDGAFHETCQAVSDHHAYGHDTVVFVISNGLYGIEQSIVNPNPFRTPPVDYPDHPLQNAPYVYNELPPWNFVALAEGWGGVGRTVSNAAELAAVLTEIRGTPGRNFVVEVVVPQLDIPSALATDVVGEDETANPGWPPASTF
ncbi:MAG: thiamine pyrophosphate-binding protein [Solirubrobacteraceae bacterium]|nr:thiamine pyrophosphate-binding protein [Solirubrobacteraceae bacterium]